MRRKLRREIFVPTALLAAVIAVSLGFLGWESLREGRALEVEANDVRAATALALALSGASQEEERAISALVLHADGAQAARVFDAAERVSRLSVEMGALPVSPRASDVWRRFVVTRGALRPLTDEVVGAARRADAGATGVALEKWHLMDDRADRLLADVTAYHLNRLDRTMSDLQRRRTHALVAAAVAFVFGLLVAVAFAAVLARAVVRPIVDMAEAAKRIHASGAPEPVAGADRRDEIGVLARAFNDMTERLTSANATLAAANARLGEAVKVRDDFISIASHELKTPLTPLALRVQQLLRVADAADGPVPRERLAHVTRNLEDHVAKLARLVESLLDVSRINSGQLTLRVEEFALAAAVRDAVDRVAGELAAAACPVRVDASADVVVRGDRVRLEQVIVNLLSNAAKYAPGAAVTVRMVPGEDGTAVVEVQDVGPGIGPEDQERIFQRFERAPTDRSVSGLGLGLFICREIVHAHGGELSVRSAPGQGSTFAMKVPVAAS